MSTAAGKPRTTRAIKAAAPAKPAAEQATAVSLDLDTLEREDRRDPFTFLHDGRVYSIVDPQELDWQEQIRAVGDPIYFLQHAMSSEDVDALFKTKLAAWKMDKIIKAYQEHFALPSSGE